MPENIFSHFPFFHRMPDLTGYVTTKEAAELLGYHIDHVRRMLREGDLKGRKVGYMWFVLLDSIRAYQEANKEFNKFDRRRGNAPAKK
ncbi:MAG: DNA-binding protein [Gammaproteobacteria bacterium]|nr:MAG: DNA-binding protein [Gammaproteobacteria bacterium]